MTICHFFLQGRCKFGDNCKNEHPRDNNQGNRFAALSNQGGPGRGRSGGFGGGGDRYRPGQQGGRDQPAPYHLNAEHIRADLTSGGDGERPMWPLSCYGPGRDAPRQLLEGAIEQSPEECRVLYHQAVAAGMVGEYANNETNTVNQANQQIQAILSDLDGAIKYVIEGEPQHPNRLDHVVKSNQSFRSQQSGFGQPTPSTGPSSTFGSRPSGFGGGPGSSFGQPSQPGGASGGSSAFGQPSQLGGGSGGGSAFGQPSQLGGGGGSGGFGQPSGLGGKPSPFGQQAGSGSSFGAPSTLGGGGSAFGQASSLGASKPSPFGGQPNQPAFGSAAFGQPSQPFGGAQQPQQQQQSPFANAAGQQSGFAAAASQSSGFGNAAQPSAQQPSNPFAQAAGQQSSSFASGGAQAGNNPFGNKPTNTATFGQPTQPSSGFGQPSQPGGGGSAFRSGFGQTSQPDVPPSQASGPFGAAPQPTAAAPAAGLPQTNGAFATGPAATSHYTTRTGTGSLQTWKGQPVLYDEQNQPTIQNPQTGKAERIWHPNGPPQNPNPYAEAPPEKYMGELGAVLKEVYDYVNETGTFKDGLMPEIPPKREWMRWDLYVAFPCRLSPSTGTLPSASSRMAQGPDHGKTGRTLAMQTSYSGIFGASSRPPTAPAMPAMLDDPSSPAIYRVSGTSPFPTPYGPLPSDIALRQVTLRDRATIATLVPFSSPQQAPHRLTAFLCELLNREIEKGDTYPMTDPMPLSSFGPYWFANFGAVMVLGDVGSIEELHTMEAQDVDWSKECLGSFYVKPNYP
ncbi:hypothetical protein KC327_g18288, partial [Hortaea werneckii]